MKDKNGKRLRVDDKVEITFYSYYEPLCSCIGRVNVDDKIEILKGIEPKDYYCREITKIDQDFYLHFGGDDLKFILNGCDISFIAEAPEDITLKQLLEQCDKIKPDWCACGICSYDKVYESDYEPEIIIGYDSIRKANDDVSCKIEGE